ncbi:ribosomal RNA small subunit methyltransferase G [Candidatus Rickettsiella viridis]|uniref:Ribosomal RNA small subunit methyltransferase G n=1 Tax=Candidatus Rickettsiella viridis TaxID=676208 RepID=A0A2Z5UXA7_9COXI|nr:16S rRNA (guanine(527)-N(7))-methyltransferase RsmG [Candidatus Rickettsiella viridis]BBB15761.1 ribosomal RNA small subunit methyltransferase G [Candidatus Rickettsiella viridis]
MMNAAQLHTNLQKQLTQNHLTFSEPVVAKLTDYLLLLEKWGQVYNLTSIRDPNLMIPKHILDSLSISPYLQGTRVLDVGTGAGLPGIPLALTHPNCHFTLLDSNGKKTRFITHVIQKLAISNIDIIQTRVEQFQTNICFDSIITRAFTSLTDFLKKTQHLACQKGIFLSMKGQYPTEEINQLDATFSVMSVNPIQIHGLNEKRHVIVIKLQP